ncbi:hypothetical protein RIF29_29588 [Crotalaria pallida]|uniref:Uncharacterized protein n=1 Tax=Crotalaria pallida TaxID=3830 RepID=A0AAN9EF92_CROPI
MFPLLCFLRACFELGEEGGKSLAPPAGHYRSLGEKKKEKQFSLKKRVTSIQNLKEANLCKLKNPKGNGRRPGSNSNSKTQGNSCVSFLTSNSGNNYNEKTQGNSCGSFLTPKSGNNSNEKSQGNSCDSFLTPKSGNNSNEKSQGNSCDSFLTPKSGNNSNEKSQGNSCDSFLTPKSGNNSNEKSQGNSCDSFLTPKSGNNSNEKSQGNSCDSFLTPKSAEMLTSTSMRRLQPGRTVLGSTLSLNDTRLNLQNSFDPKNHPNVSAHTHVKSTGRESALSDVTNTINARRERLKSLF